MSLRRLLVAALLSSGAVACGSNVTSADDASAEDAAAVDADASDAGGDVEPRPDADAGQGGDPAEEIDEPDGAGVDTDAAVDPGADVDADAGDADADGSTGEDPVDPDTDAAIDGDAGGDAGADPDVQFDASDGTSDVPFDAGGRTSTLQVVNLALGFTSVDAHQQGDSIPFAEGLRFGDGSGHVVVPISSQPVDFRDPAAGISIALGVPAFGHHIDEVWTGGVYGADGVYEAMLFREDSSRPPEGIRWRAVNGIPDTDIDLLFVGERGADTFYENVGFGERTRDAAFPPADYRIGVDLDHAEPVDFVYQLGPIPLDGQVTMWVGRDADGEVVVALTFKSGDYRLVRPL
ncbi:MAG: hypothetical protein H6700_00755 [Myxococcales bacterium]|nr:hypothetical protein [Myxococcales bacterium]